MKNHRRAHSLRSLAILILCLSLCQNVLAGVLTLPAGTKVIEEEAFFGDQSIDEIVLPEGIERIEERAFADSTVSRVNLPSSLEFIADNAFGSSSDIDIAANEETYAYEWAIENGYHPHMPEDPVTDFTYENNEDGTCTIKKYNGSKPEVVIPHRNSEGRIVSAIGDSAFEGKEKLTYVMIPEGVTRIDHEAFSRCSNLTKVVFPQSLLSIGERAFSSCTSLIKVAFTEHLTTIGERAFYNCAGLESIILPESLSNIADYAFSHCTSLISISFPSGMTSTGKYTFSACSNLTNVTIPDNITSIGEHTFYNCISLTCITIPGSVTDIGHSAFRGCTSLTNISICEGVTSIGDYAFYGCSSVKSIMIPHSMDSIGQHAFGYCTSLSNINILEGVTSIGPLAFVACNSLTSVAFPKSVTSVGFRTFELCENLTTLMFASGDLVVGGIFMDSFPLERIYCIEDSEVWKYVYYQTKYRDCIIFWNGDFSSISDEEKITGCFTEEIMTIDLGATAPLAGTVSSIGTPIHRVILTISDWNQDGTNNNRYRSRTFDGQNLYEISLTDPEWADEFILDTTQEPLNTPGEYIINLWADTEEGGGVKLDSMTLLVVGDYRIDGVINTVLGNPIENVYVFVQSTEDSTDLTIRASGH